AVPEPGRAALLAAVAGDVRAVRPQRLPGDDGPDPVLAGHRPPPTEARLAPRHLRRPLGAADVQLEFDRDSAAPHRRAGRALHLLQRRRVPRPAVFLA